MTCLLLLLWTALGLCVGSFCNVLIFRLPRGEEFVKTPSHCMACGHRLRWYELIPVASWLMQGGKCRACGEKISAQYPVVEALNGGAWLLAAWLVLLFVSVVVEYGTERALAFRDVCAILVAGVAIPMAFQCLMALRLLEHGGGLVMIPLVAAFCSDSAALFAGMALGKHKLAPRVSPKKSWEGFFAGLAGSALFWCLFTLIPGVNLSIPMALVFGVVSGLCGVLGDLAESRIKRNVGFKDSGTLLPGHGGLLDRCDSLFLVAVASAILLVAGNCIPFTWHFM